MRLWSSCRNYNPVERRSKGGKERSSKGGQKISKSLQTNNMHNTGSGDTIGHHKTSGYLEPLNFLCACASLFYWTPVTYYHCCLMHYVIGPRQGKTHGANSSQEVLALSKEVFTLFFCWICPFRFEI